MYRVPLSEKIGDLADKHVVTLEEDTLVGVAARIMRDNDLSCVLVSRKKSNDPIEIVTERDMLYRVLAENKGPYKVNLGSIMSSPLITIGYNSSASDAISAMRSKNIRRLAVQQMKGGKIIGIVTLMSVVGNIPSQSIELAEVQLPEDLVAGGRGVISCPYCNSTFECKNDITRHIDERHILNS
ncbi:MAG TPA: CBS domain-containing protein [Candidatus Bathyarchaeia archaeon]|nr:CBS domain-containing protein [Candidatus Bathyarchaeia archaeon]